jgi:hypothetical protein
MKNATRRRWEHVKDPQEHTKQSNGARESCKHTNGEKCAPMGIEGRR